MTYQLKKLAEAMPPKGPVVLLILDGLGMGPEGPENAVFMAKTPHLDSYFKGPLFRLLKAHGKAVGMPTDQDMGNSEVGHNALGAGRVFNQGATLVQEAIDSGRFAESDAWKKTVAHVNKQQKTLHFLSLLSDGNVHSHINHLIAMIKKAALEGVQKLRLHILLDGRDVGGRSALRYIEKIETVLQDAVGASAGDYRIASGGGRMLMTMDRYGADWGMVKRGWETHVLGRGPAFSSAKEAVLDAYQDETLNDQYIPPFVIHKQGHAIGSIQDGDAVILANFRGDRAIEISRAFEEPSFSEFDRERVPEVFFSGMMEYDGDLHIPKRYLVKPPCIKGSLSDYLCAEGVRSFAISETQKYGHVTFFWNGNKSGYVNETLETYREVSSENIPFNQKPVMQAPLITEETIKAIESGQYDFIRVNFPNPDMVGHTGDFEATKEAIEAVDACVSKVVEALKKCQGTVVILADHGNADKMYSDKNGVKEPHTAHTLNPVPFVLISADRPWCLTDLKEPGLANVAATLCALLGFEAPDSYEPSLLAPS